MDGDSPDTITQKTNNYRLRAADILLVHAKRDLWSWLIRLGTRCYWNHALLVCSPGDIRHGSRKAVIIDAKTSGAIVIGYADEYFDRPDKYDVAVKRLEADWFQANGSASSLDFPSHICAIAVNEVDMRLGLHFTEAIDKIIRQFIVIYRFLRRKIKKFYTPPRLPWDIRPVQVKAFTCGGFVQWCYYQGVSRRIEISGAGQFHLDEVIFNPRAVKAPSPYEMLTTTPADLARCEKLAWKYIVKDGIIREVSGARQVTAINALL